MGKWFNSLRHQIRSNLVALISLTVALAGLGYNTWRNETTESQRNVRLAAFELVRTLEELQQTVNLATYGGENPSRLIIVGWGHVGLVRDIAPLVSEDSGEAGLALFHLWEARAQSLERWHVDDPELMAVAVQAEHQVSKQISAVRTAVLARLKALE